MRIQEARMKKTKKVNKPYESSHLSRYGENLFSSNRESIFIALRRNSHHIEKRFSIKGEHLLLYIPVFSLALCTFSSFPCTPLYTQFRKSHYLDLRNNNLKSKSYETFFPFMVPSSGLTPDSRMRKSVRRKKPPTLPVRSLMLST